MKASCEILANTFTFGLTDAFGLTNSDQYQGAEYTAARFAAGVAVTAATLIPIANAAANAARAGTAGNAAKATDKAWKDLIVGQAHGADPHKIRTYREAITMAKSGEYDAIYLNKSLSTATKGGTKSLQRPDVTGVTKSGKVDMVEVRSPSQTVSSQKDKIRNMQDLLGDKAGPNSRVVDPTRSNLP